jgi:hypothetical protein
MIKSILKETFSDAGSDGEFDQIFKSDKYKLMTNKYNERSNDQISITNTVDNHKLQNDFVQFPPHVSHKALGKLKINSSPGTYHNKLIFLCYTVNSVEKTLT